MREGERELFVGWQLSLSKVIECIVVLTPPPPTKDLSGWIADNANS